MASFFVSRIDTEVDERLEVCATAAADAREAERLRSLRGKLAVANAKLGQAFREAFTSARFQALANRGAKVQRPPVDFRVTHTGDDICLLMTHRRGVGSMCAGITTYNSLRHSGALPGAVVAILGVGGLGHLAVQFAAKMGFHTVAIARGTDKEPSRSHQVYRACRAEHWWKASSSVGGPFLRKRASHSGR